MRYLLILPFVLFLVWCGGVYGAFTPELKTEITKITELKAKPGKRFTISRPGYMGISNDAVCILDNLSDRSDCFNFLGMSPSGLQDRYTSTTNAWRLEDENEARIIMKIKKINQD